MATGAEFGGARVDQDVPLTSLTTLRVGPVARRVITCRTSAQIVATLRSLDPADGPILVLAGGSNVVVADDLGELTVVRLATSGIAVDPPLLRAEAGADWDAVVQRALAANLGGLECLSGIPGSAGATPVQNVGAYGVEVADRLTRIRLLHRHSGEQRWVAAAELDFGYRHSALKHSDTEVVLEVEFELESGRSAPVRYAELADALRVPVGAAADPAAVRAAVLALRSAKGMVLDVNDHDTWSVGSFFTNPVVTSERFEDIRAVAGADVPHFAVSDGVKIAAAWLVERAGFSKGYPGSGPCRLSTKHALAVTNRGGASTTDVLNLARAIRDGVQAAFGVTLLPEPVLVGCTL